MAIARETVLTNIKPLEGAIIRRYTYGGTVVAGNLVAINSSGQAVKANTTSITLATVLGVALQSGASADRGDVVIFGPVQCLTGATKGALVYGTDTAGEPGETAGTKTSVAGVNESDTVLFVRPFQTVFS